MFGRRMTRSGRLKLIGLAFAALAFILVLIAPLATISIKVDLPPASGPTRSPTPAEWGTGAAFVLVSLFALVAMIGVPIWIIRSAWKIIMAQPKAEP